MVYFIKDNTEHFATAIAFKSCSVTQTVSGDKTLLCVYLARTVRFVRECLGEGYVAETNKDT